MKLKIAHLTATFWPDNSGTANVAYHNAAELVRLGHEVHIFTPRRPNTAVTERLDGVIIQRIRPLLRYGNASFLPQLIYKLLSFDLVHIHMPFYGGAEAVALLKWLTHKPVVITHHQDVQLDGAIGHISRFHDATVTKWLMKRANRVCFTSIDYARSSKFASLQHEGAHFAELPNGIDPHRFQPSCNLHAQPLPFNFKNKFVALFVGVLDRAHYFKGVEKLIRAIQKLQQQQLVLLIVGKGNMKPQYQQLANELGIGHQVYFTGFVPDAQLSQMYQIADVTVLPSTTMGEAFGLVLLESLACGTPVIASTLPGVRTVVADGHDGFLTQPGNVEDLAHKLMTMILMPDAVRQAMGQAGRQKVLEKYAWSKIGAQLHHLYADILKIPTLAMDVENRVTHDK